MPFKTGMYVEKIHTQGELYLTRVHVTPWKWWPFKRRIYLHIFSRPDADRVFHDHPWDFTTIVLWGGYNEVCHVISDTAEVLGTNGVWQKVPTGEYKADRLSFLSIRYRPKTHAHRITKLHTKRVVTLIIRGERERDWGFWCPPNRPEFDGITRSTINNPTDQWHWVYWREYLDIPDTSIGEQY